MDKLVLCWIQEPLTKRQRQPIERLAVHINNKSVEELVIEYEKNHQMTPYNDIFLKRDDVDFYTRNAWLRSLEPGNERIILLACGCGQVECSNFFVDVVHQDGWVYWAFGGDPERDYSQMPTFWFPFAVYQQMVLKLFDDAQ